MPAIHLPRPLLHWALPFLIFLLLVAGLRGLSTVATAVKGGPPHDPWTSHQRIAAALASGDSLVLDSNAWFLSSGMCASCHGSDSTGVAMVTSTGADVNFVDDWRATMMANSARDPFWKAQVSHEGIVDPGHKDLLEGECTTCHAPMGNFSHGLLQPGQHYSLNDLAGDALGQDGVSCMACHAMSSSQGAVFSGQFSLDTSRVAFGPFPGAFAGPMLDSINILPAYGPQILESEVCASCHTLVNQTIDLQGNFTGNSFVEQATYHEWVNSSYPNQGETCQSCHLPQLQEQILISAHYPNQINPRSPYGLHQMVGANSFMLKLLQANIDTLGLTAEPVHFDSVIARTERMLQQQSLELDLYWGSRSLDTAVYRVRIENRAGHKFPSGYPSRRAFVEFVARDGAGDTLFASGLLGSNGEIIGQDPDFEPHYEVINQPGQVQVYEFIMGDVNGDVTTTLRRGAIHLKDNRLLPKGFSNTHANYDTVEVAGLAVVDPDFQNGAGRDEIEYRIPLNGSTDSLQISVRVYYQTVRPGWLDETFANSSPEIDLFQSQYNAADKSPVLMAELNESALLTEVKVPGSMPIHLWPNPAPEGEVFIEVGNPGTVEWVEVLDQTGKVLRRYPGTLQVLYHIKLGESKGVYWIRVVGKRSSWAGKVVRL